VPAAAVIPAPIAYIKVVAVKKLVVGFQETHLGIPVCSLRSPDCYCEKIRVFKAGNCRNILAWNNECVYNLVNCRFQLIGTVGGISI
jgi:hypothetical protein